VGGTNGVDGEGSGYGANHDHAGVGGPARLSDPVSERTSAVSSREMQALSQSLLAV
jgi:hypothetical protein